MKNWDATIISQYAKSVKLLSLVELENEVIDPDVDIQAFYDNVFNPKTAVGWGLDCWGQIVGIGRTLELDGNDTILGFNGSQLQPFGEGTFYSENSTSFYRLSDEAYRKLIFFKASINIGDGTMKSLNYIINSLFGGNGYAGVLHVGTMRLRFLFDHYLQPYESAMLAKEDVPPKPAGVTYDVYEILFDKTFGFAGSGLLPFNQGVFPLHGPKEAYSD